MLALYAVVAKGLAAKQRLIEAEAPTVTFQYSKSKQLELLHD